MHADEVSGFFHPRASASILWLILLYIELNNREKSSRRDFFWAEPRVDSRLRCKHLTPASIPSTLSAFRIIFLLAENIFCRNALKSAAVLASWS